MQAGKLYLPLSFLDFPIPGFAFEKIHLLRRLPRAGRSTNAEKIARENSLCSIGALRVPLHANDEMIGRVGLNCFDDAIVGRNCCHAQIISDFANCLMMARIHLYIGLADVREDFLQPRLIRDFHWMRLDYFAAGPVIDGSFQILNERSTAPDVQRLRSWQMARIGLR